MIIIYVFYVIRGVCRWNGCDDEEQTELLEKRMFAGVERIGESVFVRVCLVVPFYGAERGSGGLTHLTLSHIGTEYADGDTAMQGRKCCVSSPGEASETVCMSYLTSVYHLMRLTDFNAFIFSKFLHKLSMSSVE